MIQSTRPPGSPRLSSHAVSQAIELRSPRSRSTRWVLAGLLVAGLAGGGAAYQAWRADSQALSFRTENLAVREVRRTVTATGTLEPLRRVDVGSELSGILREVLVDHNDRVEAGQVLARLDTELFEAQALRSRASLQGSLARVEEARAAEFEARRNLERLKEVQEASGGRLPAAREMDTAIASLARSEAQFASAQADVEIARANLSLDETNLERCVILSPVSGIVLDRLVEDGQTIVANLQAPQLFVLAEDLESMELLVDIDEADVGLVRPGQPASFRVDAYPGVEFPAELTQVRYASETSDGVVTYKGVLQVENRDLRLRPGMTATAGLIVAEISDQIAVPNVALRFTPPGAQRQAADSVFCLGADGEPQELAVTLGLSDGLYSVVEGEVSVGYQVLIGTGEVRQ